MTRAKLLDGGANAAAFLDMIAHSEIGARQLAETDDGYNVLVGSLPDRLMLFPSYAAHPHQLNRALNSTAAGRYQIIFPTWSGIVRLMFLPDFSPVNQDRAAVQLLKECGALAALARGDFDTALLHASREWASLPGSTAGQHVNKRDELLAVYLKAGGTVAEGVHA